MEFKHISIVVVKIGRKGNLAAFTDIVFSNSCVNNRIVVHKNISFRSCSTTIIIDEFDTEIISIISIRSCKNDVLAVSAGLAGKSDIIFIPCEMIISSRSRGDISGHLDVACQSVAYDRIRSDDKYRVRKNCNSSIVENVRFAVRSGLTNTYTINVGCKVAIIGLRSLAVVSGNSTLDDFTIAVPSIDFTARNTTADMSGQLDFAAFANCIVDEVCSDIVNNRVVINNDSNSSNVETTLVVIVHQVGNLNFVSGVSRRSECFNGLCHSSNCIADLVTVCVPLILKHRIVVIVKMSSKSNFSALADCGLVSGNVNLRLAININLERFTHRSTTISICDFNGK